MPTTTTTLVRRRNAVAIITGIADVAISLTVLAGYLFHSASLVILIPGSAPMRLATAIALLCCGGAVLLLAGGYFRAAAAGAAVCGAIGLATLGEVIAGARIAGIDPTAFAGGAPARAGALIGCLLTLAAVALMLMARVARPHSRLAIVGAIGSTLHCIGIVAVVSYLAGVSSAFTTGAYSQLSVHTSVALAALGAALIRFAWRDSMADRSGAPAWTPLLIGVGVLSTSFCLYGAIAADEKSDFANEVSFEADSLRQFIQSGLDNRIQPLIRMARRRASAPNLSQQDWDADAQAILTRGGYQAIEWIDASGRAVWTTPPGAGDATPDGNAAFEPRRRAALDAARQRRELAATSPIDLVTGGKGMIVAVPVFVRGELAGYVAGVFRHQLLFQNLLASNPSSRYGISVRSNGETVFEQGAATRLPGLKRSVELAVGSSRWSLEIAPTEALAVQARSPVAGALLVAGAFLAILLAMLAYLIQKGGGRAGVDAAPAGLPAPLARFARKATLPVVSYHRDGALLAFNESARALFGSAPPDIPACGEFRVVSATIVQAGVNSESVDALRQLLESCAEPALVFGVEGQFIAANRAASQALGWSDSLWSGRAIGGAVSGRHETLTVQNVVLMQGEWELSRSRAAAATT